MSFYPRTQESALDVPTLKLNGTAVTATAVELNKLDAATQAHIADASTAHALNAVFSDAEVETALDALGTKINSILAVLEAYGLTATS